LYKNLQKLPSVCVFYPATKIAECVCVLPGSEGWELAFYFKIENRRDILITALLTRNWGLSALPGLPPRQTKLHTGNNKNIL